MAHRENLLASVQRHLEASSDEALCQASIAPNLRAERQGVSKREARMNDLVVSLVVLSGAFSVLTALIAVTRVSTMVVTPAAPLGQPVASLAIDHFGMFGMPRAPIHAWRITGVL